MNLRLSLGLLAGVVIAACGGGDGGETGSDGGATGEPLTEVPFDEFYARAETAFCAWQVACGQYGVEARCASVNHLDLRLSMQRISGVGIADSVPLDYMREAIELGRIGYDEEAAAACLEYVRGRSCEWAQLHALSEAELAGQTACAAVFTGRMGRNGPCISASECAGTAICGFDPACVDACCVGACRVLPEPRKIGEACTGGNPGCEPNSFCDFDPNTGMPTVCTAAPKLGQQSIEDQVLRVLERELVTAFKLDADREIVATRAPQPIRNTGMPGAPRARNKLDQIAVAADEKV